MSIQLLTSVVYEIVSHSWSFASITAKYYLAVLGAYLYTQGKLSKSEAKQKILSDARKVITGFAAAGTTLYIIGAQPEPFFKAFSQLIALAYLGYLFWEY